MGTLVAGVDCSTQATKVQIIDVDSGAVVATGRHDHTVTGTDGARETEPREWWSALCSALAQTNQAADVDAIAIGGQQHGLVTLDERGMPLRPAMLWNDTRSAPDAQALTDALGGAGAWADRIGVVPVPSFTVSKWAWLKRTQPLVSAKVSAVRLPHDYLTQCLTGRGVTDRGDASGTGWWSASEDGYDQQILLLDAIQLDPSMLPLVAGPTDLAGEVTTTAAAESGLSAGTPVAVGTGDNMAAALGLGLDVGTPVISLGTSGVAYAIGTTQAADPTGTVAGFADATGRFLPLACTLNCTLAVDHIAKLFGLDREDIAPDSNCVVLPYLDGERTPNLPLAAGSIVGLRHTTTRQEILRAAYEGAAEALMTALGMINQHGAPLSAGSPLILIGGGARGVAWRDVVGRLSGRELLVPDEIELVATGAAVQAAAALTGEALLEIARRWDTCRGQRFPAVARDTERLEHIGEVRTRLKDLNDG